MYALLVIGIINAAFALPSTSPAPESSMCAHSEPTKFVDPHRCCQKEPFFKLKDIIHECKQQIQEPKDKLDSFVTPNQCFDQCVFNMSGFLNEKGDINVEKIRATFKEGIANSPEWDQPGNAALTKCISSPNTSIPPDATCKSGATQFIMCFKRETFLNCPPTLWSGDAACVELKTHLEMCPQAYPPISRKGGHN